MCFYARTNFKCGDWRWGKMKQRCSRQPRIGETCGAKLVDHENVAIEDEDCRTCQTKAVKLRRLRREKDNIKRWSLEGTRFHASIEKAQREVSQLEQVIAELESRRTSVQHSPKEGRPTPVHLQSEECHRTSVQCALEGARHCGMQATRSGMESFPNLDDLSGNLTEAVSSRQDSSDQADTAPDNVSNGFAPGFTVPPSLISPEYMPSPIGSHHQVSPTVSNGGEIGSGRNRRGNLPKNITTSLKAWLMAHLDYPYPSEDEKQHFTINTGLSIAQISNWFINARRRYLSQYNPKSATSIMVAHGDQSEITSFSDGLNSHAWSRQQITEMNHVGSMAGSQREELSRLPALVSSRLDFTGKGKDYSQQKLDEAAQSLVAAASPKLTLDEVFVSVERSVSSPPVKMEISSDEESFIFDGKSPTSLSPDVETKFDEIASNIGRELVKDFLARYKGFTNHPSVPVPASATNKVASCTSSIFATSSLASTLVTQSSSRQVRAGDDGWEENDSRAPKRPRLEDLDDDADDLPQLLACPYAKYDAPRYSERNSNAAEKAYRKCASKYLTNIPKVKQHLYRVHRRPEIYCSSCYLIFKTSNEHDDHSRQRPACTVQVEMFTEKMTSDQFKAVKRRKMGGDRVAKWFEIYRILFPRSTPPDNPYASILNSTASLRVVREFVELVEREGARMLSERMVIPVYGPENAQWAQWGLNQILEETLPLVMQELNQQFQAMEDMGAMPTTES